MSGPSDSTIRKQNDIAQGELDISKSQDARSSQLFNLALPGMQKSEDYYTKLASGDSNTIYNAIAPATEQIAQQGQAADKQMRQSMPRGGVERLAEAQNEVATTGQIGRLASQSYTSAFPALGEMGKAGVGLSINSAANAISAGNSAGNIMSNVGQEQASGKAATMGMVSGLASTAGAVAMA